MATRIEFSVHGDENVLQCVDYEPAIPRADEVQIAHQAIGVNYIDTYVRSGLYPPPTLPSGLGSEAAGIVLAVGAEVSHLSVGDRVVYAQAPLGAYSEIHTVPAAKVIRLPDDISMEQAAASFLKGLTVYYLFHQTYALQAGDTFLFHAAAGGVGLLACQWAKALGARMIGTVSSAEKAARAEAAGAWATINYTQEEIVQRVNELTQEAKVPVVYDSVGKNTWLDSLNCLQRRGLMVSFGNASGPVTGVDLGILNQKGSLYVTRPSLSGYITTYEELQQASDALFAMIRCGALDVNVPDSQRFALQDVRTAHRLLESRQTQGACLLIP